MHLPYFVEAARAAVVHGLFAQAKRSPKATKISLSRMGATLDNLLNWPMTLAVTSQPMILGNHSMAISKAQDINHLKPNGNPVA